MLRSFIGQNLYHLFQAGIADITEESFHRMFNINVLGSILTIQQALKLFGDKPKDRTVPA